MEKCKLSDKLTISVSPETLESGSEQEKSTFGLLDIVANDNHLAQGVELENRIVRNGPFVPGYSLAEWLAWNWWRIRWEAGKPSKAPALIHWEFAHRMLNVGNGYVWPDISIFTDGKDVFLCSRRSTNPDCLLFRYLGHFGVERISTTTFENAIDSFIKSMLVKLESDGMQNSNLHKIWDDLCSEREDLEISRFRKLEAQLSCDPDSVEENLIFDRLNEVDRIGEKAMAELASDASIEGSPLIRMLRLKEIGEIAKRAGFDANLSHGISLETDIQSSENLVDKKPWEIGKKIARIIRRQENLGEASIPHRTLVEMAGTSENAITEHKRNSKDISFTVNQQQKPDRILLKSKWVVNRRFELARLIGDRLVYGVSELLSPATRSQTYRQKLQRAFAAELLSPFKAVDHMLNGDYSEVKQKEVATYFKVSPATIQTQLVYNNKISADDAPDIGILPAY